jgi:prolyl oligopeptidase
MKQLFLSLALLSAVPVFAQVIKAPPTRQMEQTDVYFGKKINDPYRWLEDDNSAETKVWVETENKTTYDYLAKIPFRAAVNKRLSTLWNFEKQTAPFRKAGMLFYYRNNGIQNQSVLYVQESEKVKARVLLDPNTFSADGTISITSMGISKTGKYLAYAYAKAGSDWNKIMIIDIASGKQVDEEISWIKFSGIEWQGDEGFYYSRYPEPKEGQELSAKNEFQKIAFHRIGTGGSSDKIIYEDPAFPTRGFYAGLTDKEDYLIISATESTSGNALYIKRIEEGKEEPVVKLVEGFESDWTVLDIVDEEALLLTNHKASNKRIIRLSLNQAVSGRAEATTASLTPPPAAKGGTLKDPEIVVPESKDLLESVILAGDKMILNYLHNVSSKIEVRDMNGKFLSELVLPGIGKVNSINFGRKDAIGYIDFSTFTAPTAIYKYTLTGNKLDLVFRPKTLFQSEAYETKQVFYTGKDGTKIPMFIVAKKGIKLDGTNPCFLFGYGGFNAFYSPEFRIDRCLFLEQGGVYAIPGLRGGGEYGEDWHKAGTIFNKQNVFNDFIAAAEYLFVNKYTNKDKLAIHGRSNGGLLIGAVMTQRPDLCKVAIPAVGVLDMLRYHKFTIGWAWATDYGTSDDEKQFENLLKYSPLHNIKNVNYPATLITTGDHDDRVVPAHSFKFAAALQEKNAGNNPVLIRIDINAGHGAGKPTSKQIDEYADMWSFVFENLGIKPKY